MEVATKDPAAVKHVQIVSESKLSFGQMWNRHDLSDMTLCCEQREFPVHRFLLSACSPYFRKFNESHQSKKKLNIVIENVSSDDLERVLLYMYHGSLSIKQEDIQGLCEVLEMFEMHLPEEIIASDSDNETDNDSVNEGNY